VDHRINLANPKSIAGTLERVSSDVATRSLNTRHSEIQPSGITGTERLEEKYQKRDKRILSNRLKQYLVPEEETNWLRVAVRTWDRSRRKTRGESLVRAA